MPLLAGSSTRLRRHGDEVARLPGGFYRALGRADDTMNLGGIKVGLMVQSSGIISGLKIEASCLPPGSNDTMNLSGIKVGVVLRISPSILLSGSQ